ncbi:hypothetical protein [Serratia entomophila]|uniref:hypothetical protein n=1 Tax=Serratia entomophila TaxID=42906 RepID=UPI00217A5CDC|nr:hypothetical protein [Serratia entomophila]CAI0829862.1 Uncharacterised protein [Serratia entomophila]CAI1653546.1 Uncharacterised protein [Serratia entomophila]CAI1891938.1 Uncharacterised protein [Serratia entomophila]
MTRGPTLEELRTHGAYMLSELKRNHGGFFSGVTMTQTLTTERLKALLDELKSWQYGYDPVDDKEQFDMLATAEWAVIELLANREAQPVYQYRMRNPYNGQVTDWETIKPEKVDFILKETIAANVEFRIIAAPPAPSDTTPIYLRRIAYSAPAAPEQNKPADHVWVKCAACGFITHQHFDHCSVHCGEVMAAAPEGGN